MGTAMSKTCPIMTRPISQAMGGDTAFVQPDMPLTWYQNCMGNSCMAWEPTMDRHGVDSTTHGYCKLLEKDQYE